jgi:hypothetical protein
MVRPSGGKVVIEENEGRSNCTAESNRRAVMPCQKVGLEAASSRSVLVTLG